MSESARERTPWGTFEMTKSHLQTGPLSSTPGTAARLEQQLKRDLWKAADRPAPESVRPAARTVAHWSIDTTDCRELLGMLGLLELL